MAEQSDNRVKRVKIEGAEIEDRISSLPDHLISEIFTQLPTEFTIRTGVLSKRWKNLWKKMSNLRFDKKHHKRRFNSNVLNALTTHGISSLRSLKISVEDECERLDLSIWTSIAVGRNVSKLVIILKNVVDRPVFPDTNLRYAKTLKILKLVGNLMFKIPDSCVSLESLEELHLYHSRFHDAESLSNLLLGCPILKELVVELYIESGVEIFCITMQSLEKLTLGIKYCEEENFVIEAPCLKYLNIHKFDGVESCMISRIAEIVEVKISHHDENMDENIVASITSAKVLSLCSPLKIPARKVFCRLTSLELFTYGWNWCQLLFYFLDSSPNLQVLKLVGGFFSRISRTWIEPQVVPNCFHNNLNTLVWTKYIWDGEDDKDVATYIHAAHLKKATFITSAPPNTDFIARRRLRLRELASVQTASTTCDLLFINRAYDEYFETFVKDSDLDDFLE